MFRPNEITGTDNDDVHEQGWLFYEIKHWNSGRTGSQFLASIKNDVGSSTEEATSIQKLSDIHKRPPQVKNVYVTVGCDHGCQYYVSWACQVYMNDMYGGGQYTLEYIKN